ncbi:MAG: hypothetical protein U0694_17805 [Anaerolineae bacterium]
MHDDERLRAMLREDTDSDEKADALLATVKRLRQWQAPEAANTPALVSLLAAQMPRKLSRRERLLAWYPLLLLRTQIRVVSREILLASALVITLGVLVTLFTDERSFGGLSALTVIAPIVAAVGIALLYDRDAERLLELEDSTRTSARQLLLARLTLVFGFDLVLGVLGSLLLVLLRSELSLLPLVLSWLAPMTFLSGLAFMLSVLLFEAAYAAVFSTFLWVFHLFLREIRANSGVWALLDALTMPETRPLLLLTGAALAALGLWLAGHIERKVGNNP